MEYLENNKIKNEVIKKLIVKLDDYKDITVYASDLAYTLFEEYNVDGSITYSIYEAKKWISSNFDGLSEIVDEIQYEGLELPNIFNEPEKFMVIIYLEVANYLLDQCQIIADNWNNKLILNNNIIKIIKKELKEQLN